MLAAFAAGPAFAREPDTVIRGATVFGGDDVLETATVTIRGHTIEARGRSRRVFSLGASGAGREFRSAASGVPPPVDKGGYGVEPNTVREESAWSRWVRHVWLVYLMLLVLPLFLRPTSAWQWAVNGAALAVFFGLYGWAQRARGAALACGIGGIFGLGVALLPINPGALCLFMYAVSLALREAVTNVVRHARADRCAIRLRREGDCIRLDVEDDGVGGVPAGGNGLAGMRARIAEVGGAVEHDGRDGWRLAVSMPAGGASPPPPAAAALAAPAAS